MNSDDKWFLCQLIDRRDIIPAREWLYKNLKHDDYRHAYSWAGDKLVFSRNITMLRQEDVLAFCLKFKCV